MVLKNVIQKTAEINKRFVDIDPRPTCEASIIEFDAGIKLWNFGDLANTTDIDLVDTLTQISFPDIEGANGYVIDGVTITDGMKILFTGDTDIRANGKIYTVKFI